MAFDPQLFFVEDWLDLERDNYLQKICNVVVDGVLIGQYKTRLTIVPSGTVIPHGGSRGKLMANSPALYRSYTYDEECNQIASLPSIREWTQACEDAAQGIDADDPCNESSKDAQSWVECNGEVARRVKPCNTSDDPLYVEVVNSGNGGSGLKCLKDVINLVANTPLTLTFSSIASICSHEFSSSGGSVIYLSTDITANQITICSRQDLNNILYKIIGE